MKKKTPKRHAATERRPIWLPIAIGVAALVVLGLLVALWSSESGGSSLGHSHGKKSDSGGSHAGHAHAKKAGDNAAPAERDSGPPASQTPGGPAAPESRGGVTGGSITDRSVQWPTLDQWQRVVLLRDYNTRVVVGGTMMLGIAAGVIGSFTLLRKRALMGDALSHCTLPGIGLTFMVSVAAGGSGKALPVLLLGATVSGVAGLGAILLIRNLTRLKEDTALGIVLSVFFGAGVAVLGVVQRTGEGHSAGLESFIYGKTASMVAADARLIAVAAGIVLATCALLFKEFKLLCFDADYAASQGWPTIFLDVVMMALVVAVTVIGLQAVGLILIIALLIIPAAAARFWTERLLTIAFIGAGIGAASSAVGAAGSALLPSLPSGAMIVLVAAVFFVVSMMLGRRRGVVIRWWGRYQLNRKVRRQHLLRAAFERVESGNVGFDLQESLSSQTLRVGELLPMRSWSARQLRREVRRAADDELVVALSDDKFYFTPTGYQNAAQTVRNHRLWEMYLVTHADIAPSHVDRDADAIEHVLGGDMIRKLESLVNVADARIVVPPSPHTIGAVAPSRTR